MKNRVSNDFTKVFTVIPDSQTKVKSSSYLESGKYAVVDQGKDLVAGYTNTSPTVNEDSLPVIVFGDHTRAVKYVDFPFTAGADGTQILKPSSITNPRYGFYLVLHAVNQIPSKGYARHFGELKKMQFPLPSLEKQREIVEKLDSAFAEIDLLEANLKLSDDKTNQLLQSLLSASFAHSVVGSESSKPSSKEEENLTRSLPLGKVFTLEYGKPLDKEFRKVDGAFQAYGANGPISPASKYLIEGPCVIVGRKGSAGEITYVETNVWPLDVTYYIKHDPKDSDLRYLFYTLKSLDIKQFVRGVKPGLNRNDVYELAISLPAIEKQREVVKKLDSAFAEIELLKAQIRIKKGNAISLRQSFLSNAFNQMEVVD